MKSEVQSIPSTHLASKWIKCISTEGFVRGVAIQATDQMVAMANRHGLSGEAARGMAEATMGAFQTYKHQASLHRCSWIHSGP